MLLIVVAGSLAVIFWGPKTLVGLLIDASAPIMMQILIVLIGALYWKRATKQGAIVSMIGSELFLVLLWLKFIKIPISGIHNGVWAMILGVILFVVVSLLTKPVDEKVLDKFFSLFE